jgi:hypothetical protein
MALLSAKTIIPALVIGLFVYLFILNPRKTVSAPPPRNRSRTCSCRTHHPSQANVPGIGYGKSPLFASWRGAIGFMLWPRRYLRKGYRKYRKSYFKISTLREEYVLISDKEKIAEVSACGIRGHSICTLFCL